MIERGTAGRPSLLQRALGSLALATVLLLQGCGGQVSGTGNTNWQVSCETDSECPEDLRCSCQLCGPSCDGTLQCNSDGQAPTCEPATSPDACPSYASGLVQPTLVQSRFERIEGADNTSQIVLDETHLYWLDWEGNLRSQHLPTDGSPSLLEPRELRSAPEQPRTPTGPLLADATRVYWAEAGTSPANALPEPGPPPPPGRIFAASKEEGDAELLFESDEQTFSLFGVHDEQLFLVATYGTGGLYALSLQDGELRPWAPEINSEYPQIVGEAVYWREPSAGSSDVTGYFDDLFRADLAGSNKQLVVQVQGGSSVFGELVLWQEERMRQDPLVLEQNFVALDQGTGCQWRLPHRGESISFAYLADQSHVYWYSYNALGSVSSDDTELPLMPLTRVNLSQGRLEEVVVPGHDTSLGAQLLAQTTDKLFVSAGAGLVAIDKTTQADAPPAEGACIWGVDNLLAEVGESATARTACGISNAVEPENVIDSLACLQSADATVGAQFTVNTCTDCAMPTVYVSTPSGNLYSVYIEAAYFDDEIREAVVRRCQALQLDDLSVECVDAEVLYSCAEPIP